MCVNRKANENEQNVLELMETAGMPQNAINFMDRKFPHPLQAHQNLVPFTIFV